MCVSRVDGGVYVLGVKRNLSPFRWGMLRNWIGQEFGETKADCEEERSGAGVAGGSNFARVLKFSDTFPSEVGTDMGRCVCPAFLL